MDYREWQERVEESRRRWDENAAYWDRHMSGAGNDFHLELIRPVTEELLQIEGGEEVLEIACGNGNFARRLAALGCAVTATDFSPTMIARARERTGDGERIEYQVLDATDEQELLRLGEASFDRAVCNMGLMDMAAVSPLFAALRKLLRTHGTFVFSLMHPCFQNPGAVRLVEREDVEGRMEVRPAVRIKNYLSCRETEGHALQGQPASQLYFHRPLSALFGMCFDAGFVVDALEEPNFAPEKREEAPNLLAMENFPEIPPVLVVRLRPAQAATNR